MIKKISWLEKSAYTLIIQNVTQKLEVEALKLADTQKEKVIATVSHELRTPINGILGLINMCVQAGVSPKVDGYLKNAISCSKMLLHLVNSILDLS